MLEWIAWPGAAVVLGFGFMLIFRRPITAVIDRTKKVGKGGLETFESPQLPAPASKQDPLAEFMGAYDNRLLLRHEEAIRADLAARNLATPEAAQRALVRSLAGTQLLLLFERVQSLIWASQIEALTYLNSRPSPIASEEIRPFYEDARRKYPELYHGYAFEKWLAFLSSWMLVDSTHDLLALSMTGREFLKWRVEVGRSGPFHG